ncbi:fumarate reductase/succinate dehydrogenase flavoprotein subunit [Actinomycetaceae bacterium MB13-C1-2]|nr:fumarate reductase/succinate dehydrogenase flavoprotein subunit [Actinomycetaceae bacterium MB13-C1-2]
MRIRQKHGKAPAINSNIPPGDPATAWDRRRAEYRLVSPLKRHDYRIVVVGTGLAGGAAAAALGELGYDVQAITYHDAPRRAHSVAAQGGINAAREGALDADSLTRFVKDTVKGGDFRAREAEVFRLGQESMRVIDHLNALGTPFAREYGGTLATRSFGGVQVSRTFYSRGQTGQQLQIATAGALLRQVNRGTVTLHPRTELLDLVVEDGRAQGVIVRNLVDGTVSAIPAHAVVLATGGYGSVFYYSTLAISSNATAAWRAHRRGAWLANPSFVQFHPTALPVSSPWQSKTTLMSESLRNDGRIWVPKKANDSRDPLQIPESERDYYLERKYPAFGNLTPRDIASRAGSERIRSGYGVGPMKNSVYLDFSAAMKTKGKPYLAEQYGNLFQMYQSATGEDPYAVPMRIAPGAHFTMGGLWTDYDLMSNIEGLFVGGEAGFTYHGANRLGANSLLSAAVDGWFVLPLSVPNYLAGLSDQSLPDRHHHAFVAATRNVEDRVRKLLSVGGNAPPEQFHRELGDILYAGVGVERNEASLRESLDSVIRLQGRFWREVSVPGGRHHVNQTLERASRVADFLELAELMIVDALHREESCGAHFRSEYQSDGEALRDDEHWSSVSVWESMSDSLPERARFLARQEPLEFSVVEPEIRSYR